MPTTTEILTSLQSGWAAIIGIVGGITAIYALWRQWRNPEEKITVLANQQAFSIPAMPRKCLGDYESAINGELKAKSIKTWELSLPDAYRFIEQWDKGSLCRLEQCECLWTIRVDNLGRKKAVGVTVTVPGLVKVVQIKRGNKTETVEDPDSPVKVGEMAPKDVAFVYAWSLSSVRSETYDNLRVTHDTGVAKTRGIYLVSNRERVLASVAKWTIRIFLFILLNLAIIFGLTNLVLPKLVKLVQPTPQPQPTASPSPQVTSPVPQATPSPSPTPNVP